MALPFDRIPTLAQGPLVWKPQVQTERPGPGPGQRRWCGEERPGEEPGGGAAGGDRGPRAPRQGSRAARRGLGAERGASPGPPRPPAPETSLAPRGAPRLGQASSGGARTLSQEANGRSCCLTTSGLRRGGNPPRAGQAGAGPFWSDLIWWQRVPEPGGEQSLRQKRVPLGGPEPELPTSGPRVRSLVLWRALHCSPAWMREGSRSWASFL